MSLSLNNKHLAILGIIILAAVVVRLSIGDTGTTPLNPGHPLSQTWINTNLNMGTYSIATAGGLAVSGGTVSLPPNQIDSSEVSFNYAGSSSKGGAATTASALSADGSNCAGGQYAQGVDVSGNAQGCSAPAGGVSGSGTANYISKWTGGTSLGNSQIYDDGSTVNIGTTGTSRLYVSGHLILKDANNAGAIYFPNTGTYPNLYIRSDNDPNTYEPASERMFIGANGNVGIGTTSPGAKLSVSGGDAAVITQGNGVILRATNGANCYRLTVNNAGTLSTASVGCPT